MVGLRVMGDTPRRRLDAPTSLDWISEPTLNRRVWALYLARGYTRSSWSRAMGVSISIATRWDGGSVGMSVANLAYAAQTLGVTTDELIFGREGRPAADDGGADHGLVRLVLDRVDASPHTRAAFADHVATTGRYQLITQAYVERWVSAYDAELDGGATPERAARLAFAEAINARAVVSASVPPPALATVAPRPRRPRRRLPVTIARSH